MNVDTRLAGKSIRRPHRLPNETSITRATWMARNNRTWRVNMLTG